MRRFADRQRVKDRRVDAMRDDAPHEWIIALCVDADANDRGRRQKRRQQLLRVHTPLQHRTTDRRRMDRFATRAAVHHAHDRLASHPQQQAISVRNDRVELAQVHSQRENISQISGGHAYAGPRFDEPLPRQQANLVQRVSGLRVM
jgi:hypothetical protein